MYLLLNTSINAHVDVFLFDKDSTFCIQRDSDFKAAESLNEMIAEVLKKNKKKLEDISGIGVITGPGSFTATRIAVTVANALSYALKVPVLGFPLSAIAGSFDEKKARDYIFDHIDSVKEGEMATPYYDKEPNITLSK